MKSYILLLLRYTIILIIYKFKNVTEYTFQLKLTTFIFMELLEIIVFYSRSKYIKYLEIIVIIGILFNISIIETLTYFNEESINFLFYPLLLINIPLVLYLFILFLLKQKYFYLIYILVDLFWFIVLLFLASSKLLAILQKKTELENIMVVFWITSILISFLYVLLFKQNKEKLLKKGDQL